MSGHSWLAGTRSISSAPCVPSDRCQTRASCQPEIGGRNIATEFNQRAGTSNGRRIPVGNHLIEKSSRIRLLRPRRMESRRVCLEPFAPGPEPRFNGG